MTFLRECVFSFGLILMLASLLSTYAAWEGRVDVRPLVIMFAVGAMFSGETIFIPKSPID